MGGARRAGALVAAVASVGSIGVGVRGAPAGVAAASRDPVPVVAAWSARRVPDALANAVGTMRLPNEVTAAITGADACFVLSEVGREVYAHEPTTPLIPASTQKILTGLAALSVFGPDHRFVTRVLAPAEPSNGRVTRLWLVGGGDPGLASGAYRDFLERDPLHAGHPATSMEELAERVLAAGVRMVDGPVLGDDSRHSDDRVLPGWRDVYITNHDVSFLSALTVNGGWSVFDPERQTASDPPAHAAGELARILTERGVPVTAPAAAGTRPQGAREIARVESPPLSDIVEAMIRESDNLAAELLVREIALERKGVGTTAAGTQAVSEELRNLGIDVTGVGLRDGSGLDRANRATCRATHGALALSDEPAYRAVREGLALAGRTGTLHNRFRGTPAEGVLRAKTGSLRGVVGLVGLVPGPPQLAFSLIANDGFDVAGGRAVQDRIAGLIVRYPFTVDEPEVLAPPPAQPPPDPPAST